MFDKVVDAALSLCPEFHVEGTHLTNSQDEQNMGTVHFEVRTASIDATLVAKFSLSKMPGTLIDYPCEGIGQFPRPLTLRVAELE